MPEYRLKRLNKYNLVLEQCVPSRKKTEAELKKSPLPEFTKAKWVGDGQYYGNPTDLVRALIHRKITPIGPDLKSQLEDMPKAIEKAVTQIIQELKIDV